MAFTNARNVHVSSSILNQVGGNQFNINFDANQPTRTLIQTLDRLPYAAGASLNPTKICLQNTRTAILDNLWSWIKSIDANQTAEISLLTSVAGAGKTAIAHTVAQRCKVEGLLWSSFFFDREVSGRNEPRMLFSTIARDLADQNPDFGEQVADALDETTSLVGASSAVHFAELILEPSRCLPVDQPVVIIIDALDEGCDDEVLAILGNEVPNLPGTFRIFLTSRPTEDLDFHLKEKPYVRSLSIGIDEPSNLVDTGLYARHRLQMVAKRKKLAESWPGSTLLNDFISRAGGLFIWIFIVSEYLRNATDPDDVLRSLLSKHNLSSISAESRMDQMYSTILQGCNWDDQAFSRGSGLLIGAMMAAKTPLSLSALQSIHRHDLSVPVKACLQPLASLLTSLDNDHTPVQILHLSLKDFLTIRAQRSPQSRKYFLREEYHSQRLGYLCLMVLNEDLKKCQHAIGSSELTDVPDIGEDIVSEELLYACSFWIDHVIKVKVPETRFTNALRNFLSNHLVSWVEVITSKGRLQNLATLREWLDKSYPGDTVIKNYICNPDVAATFHNISQLLSCVDRREEALQAVQEAVEIRRLVFPKTGSTGFFRRIFRTKTRTRLLSKDHSTCNANLASSLDRLADCLSKLGHREEALDAIQEAIKLSQQLAKDQPAVHNTNPTYFWSLSRCLSDLGRREEALDAIKEAVESYRQVAKDRPSVYNADLASYFSMRLSRCLSDLGHREEALDAIKEAVELRRQVVKHRSAVYNASLATSLWSLSGCLSDLGHREEALDAIKETVELYQQLAKDRPLEYNDDLATSLDSLSRCLSGLGHREEALDAIKEAVELHRQLARDHPAMYNDGLASSLDNLSHCLSNLGHREEALDAIKEVVKLYRQLTNDRPAMYNDDLASSLDNFSCCLSDLGYREEALDAIEEAIGLYRLVAKEQPVVYNHALGSSLWSLSRCLSNLGHREKALDAINEAVGLYRQLAKDHPAIHNCDLSSCLDRRSRCLSYLGHREEALDTIKEAVELFRQLVKDRPSLYNDDLAFSLNRLSCCLSDIGQREHALDAINEAIELHRQLAKDLPAVYNDSLASSLDRFSCCLSDLGHQEEALDAVKEAVKLHRQLAKNRPAVYNEDLASSLDRLSHCLSDLGHREEALGAIKEAVKLYRQLANDRPSVYNADLVTSLRHFSTCLSDLGHHGETLDGEFDLQLLKD